MTTGGSSLTTTSIRRLLVGLALASGLWFASVGGAAATTVPTSAPSADATTSTTSARVEQISNPDDGFQPEDVREFAEDNLVAIIVGVGLVLVFILWRFISRPSNMKF